MEFPALKRYQPHITIVLLLFFMVVALILRILPAIITRDQAFYPIYDTDTWYNLRQIEVMVHNFPQYNWFDPMTAYPGGKTVDWGPGLPFIGAVFCLITGASTQNAIIANAGFVSPIMAVLMIPVFYGIGLKIGDWRTGIAAAGLASVSSFLYFTFSSYGMVDHHIAEVLFSTLVILTYLSAISYAGEHPPDKKNLKTFALFCGFSVLAGLLYFASIIISTTVLLVLLIIAVYTLIQSIADFFNDRDPEYLCILNLVMLGSTVTLLLLFGFRSDGLSIMNYSPGLALVHVAVAAETSVFYILSRVFRGKKGYYLPALAVLIIGGFVLIITIPALQRVSSQAIGLVSGNTAFSVGVQETLPWSVSGAFDAINVAIILVAGGFLVLAYRLIKKQEREMIFVAVWSGIMLLLTIRFQRFQYYFTVNIILLSALCIAEPFRWDIERILHRIPFIHARTSGTSKDHITRENLPVAVKPPKKKKNLIPVSDSPGISDILKLACLALVCILVVTHIGLSITRDIHYAVNANERMIPSDWLESLDWIRTATPDPDIGYFARYERNGYSVPPDSYGIMAVWDAGHWITFFSHRPPIVNPFQDNLGGSEGTAAFFLEDNESRANDILKKFRGRYIITDSDMAVDRFTNLVPWRSGSTDISRYIKWFLTTDPKNSSRLEKIHLFDNAYFQTMIVKLHIFDGSMTAPAETEYVKYTIRKPTAQESADASGFSRIITNRQTINQTGFSRNDTLIIAEGPELLPTAYANFYSEMPDAPLMTVSALAHYRLVHESPEDASVTPFPESEAFSLTGIKMVKIFEYVKGAHIPGEGIIEIPLVTDTGRVFVYRQESSGGEFVVPYSTKGNPYSVRASGPYHIIGTSHSFEVTEDAVVQGLMVT